MSNRNKNESKISNEELTKFNLPNNFDLNDIPHEIKTLTESPDFIDFVKIISSSLDDGATFNEMLSSKAILQKAIEVLKKLDENEIDDK